MVRGTVPSRQGICSELCVRLGGRRQGEQGGVGGEEPGWLPSPSPFLPSRGCALPTCQVGDRAGPRLGPCSVTALWTRDTLDRSGWPPRVRHSQGCPAPALLPITTSLLPSSAHKGGMRWPEGSTLQDTVGRARAILFPSY